MLGAPAKSTAQKIDAARGRTALDRARQLANPDAGETHRTGRPVPNRTGPRL